MTPPLLSPPSAARVRELDPEPLAFGAATGPPLDEPSGLAATPPVLYWRIGVGR
jgi:hypothetical protein